MLTIDLAGPVRVTGPDGVDLTPASMKARGILAVLGVARNQSVPRSRLQDLLWSTAPPSKAAASLRQDLSKIRSAFRYGRDALSSDGSRVWLDPSGVRVMLNPPRPGPGGTLPEFAEDLVIEDPEFEDWIRDERRHLEERWWRELADGPLADMATTMARGPVPLVIGPARGADEEGRMLSLAVIRDAASRASGLFGNPVLDGLVHVADLPMDTLSLACIAAASAVYPSLGVLKTGQLLWSASFDLRINVTSALDDAAGALLVAILNAQEASRGADRPPPLPFGDVFSFDRGRLLDADGRLRAAEDSAAAPVRLAMQAFIRHTLLLERLDDDGGMLVAEASELSREASSSAPDNAIVASVRSLVAGLNEEDGVAVELARHAVRLEPTNPFANHALSVALSFAGRPKEAHQVARGALGSRLMGLSPALHHLRHAYTALGLRNFDEASRALKMVLHYAPDCRAALRVRSALEFDAGDEEAAHRTLMQLKRYEPDFTLDLMLDSDYPIRSLRSAGLVGIARSGLL